MPKMLFAGEILGMALVIDLGILLGIIGIDRRRLLPSLLDPAGRRSRFWIAFVKQQPKWDLLRDRFNLLK
jgi:hypothetical protein